MREREHKREKREGESEQERERESARHGERVGYIRWTPHPVIVVYRNKEDPNMIPIIPYSHYYWVGGVHLTVTVHINHLQNSQGGIESIHKCWWP